MSSINSITNVNILVYDKSRVSIVSHCILNLLKNRAGRRTGNKNKIVGLIIFHVHVD